MKYKTFPSEFSGPWALCLKLFGKCYINFFEESHKDWKLYCTALFAIIHNITMWMFMSKVFTDKVNLFEFAYMIPVCLVAAQGVIKGMIVIYRKSDIEKLINELASIWKTTNLNSGQIKIKKHLIRKLKKHHSIFYWSNMFGAWLHIMSPLVVVLFRTLFLSGDSELKLAFMSIFPFDPTDNWIIYLATYSFQTFAMSRIVYSLIGAEFLMVTFCGNLAIEFALLGEDLVHVTPFIKLDDANHHSSFEQRRNLEEYRNISIEKLIRRHQHLLRLSMNLDDIFNGMILMNFLCVTINVCFFGFVITIARGFVEMASNVVAVITMLLPVYLFCYYGELMKNESLGVADSAYNNQWYNGDADFQRMIVMIIARSQRACCLTSWRQIPVTLAMFAKILSTAWSYFSIARSVYANHEDSNTN